jgi:hypothetical protein
LERGTKRKPFWSKRGIKIETTGLGQCQTEGTLWEEFMGSRVLRGHMDGKAELICDVYKDQTAEEEE